VNKLQRFHPSLVVVLSCLADVSDRRLAGETRWRSPGDPIYDANLRQSIAKNADDLSAAGAKVAWLTCPQLSPHIDPNYPGPYAEAEPSRVAHLNAVINEVKSSRPQMTVIDLASWLRQLPGGELASSRRPDGVHFGSRGGLEAANWLVPKLCQLHC
jgi:hypothetical protein